jgi:hypothetical protein
MCPWLLKAKGWGELGPADFRRSAFLHGQQAGSGEKLGPARISAHVTRATLEVVCPFRCLHVGVHAKRLLFHTVQICTASC